MISSNNSRIRKRIPIVNVYLTTNPDLSFSLSVPKSKDWVDFLQKSSEKLHFNVEKVLNVHLFIEEGPAISQDMTSNMKHIKHCQTIAIDAVEEFPASSSEEEESSEESTENYQNEIKRPFHCLNKFEHLKSKNQKLRQKIWRNISRNDWLLENATDEYYRYGRDSDEEKIEIKKLLFQNPMENLNLKNFSQNYKCCIILCHGGRFSGAVFHGKREVVHKSFSRYVVRKKQGGRQGARGPKSNSGGSWLRNFHEQKLHDEILNLLNDWSELLEECQTIFLHAPGVVNGQTLFHEDSPLTKEDPRLRTVAIRTKKPTNQEVKRVLGWMGLANYIVQDTE